MNTNLLNLKVVLGISYLVIISIGLFFLLSLVDIGDLTSYEFIKANKEIILKYKNENFLFLASVFFVFCIIWVLCLGFCMPLLLFAGFVFGKWWGMFLVLTSTTIGATLLYILVNFFFQDIVKKKLEPKFLKLKEFFDKNDLVYFMSFRFIGGAGAPFAIQNVLPVLFNMGIKNYFIATLIGGAPAMFVTAALGSGVEKVIDQNSELSFSTAMSSPDIYIPIIAFFFILVISFIIKKFYFKK